MTQPLPSVPSAAPAAAGVARPPAPDDGGDFGGMLREQMGAPGDDADAPAGGDAPVAAPMDPQAAARGPGDAVAPDDRPDLTFLSLGAAAEGPLPVAETSPAGVPGTADGPPAPGPAGAIPAVLPGEPAARTAGAPAPAASSPASARGAVRAAPAGTAPAPAPSGVAEPAFAGVDAEAPARGDGGGDFAARLAEASAGSRGAPAALPAAPTATIGSLQPAAGAGAAAPLPAGDPLAPVHTPVADPDWGSAIGARLVWGAAQGVQSASISLNPRELGPLQLSLSVKDDEASVSFVSNHLAVRDAIEAALPRLRELFASEGMVLADVDVSAGDARSGDRGDGAGQPGDRRGASDAGNAGDPSPAVPPRLSDGLVDTFA